MNRFLLVAACAALCVLSIPASAFARGNSAPPPKVVAGSGHICALSDNGTVACWGTNSKGQLGTGDTADRGAPTTIAGLSKVVTLGAYGEGTCAIKEDGTAWCWGANDQGQLGTGTPDADPHPAPVEVAAAKNSYWIAGGDAHVCAVNWETGLNCWGASAAGQLGGNGTKKIKWLAVGGAFTCVLTEKGTTPVCWGANDKGQSTPPAGVKDVYAIEAGGAHACMVSWSTPSTTCWGEGTPDLSSIGAVKLMGGSKTRTCAVAHTKLPEVAAKQSESKSAALQCWGAGNPPAAVPLEDVAELSSSSTAATQCAIVRGGALFCWPEGGTEPAQVAGLDLVTKPQYPDGKWIEPTSKLRAKGSSWRMSSKLWVVPSAFVYPELACKGTVAADVFYWKKLRKKKQAKKSGGDGAEYRRVGVRTKSKLRRSGNECTANFSHRIPMGRFAAKKRKLMLRAVGFGNSAMSSFETGEYPLKDYKKKKK